MLHSCWACWRRAGTPCEATSPVHSSLMSPRKTFLPSLEMESRGAKGEEAEGGTESSGLSADLEETLLCLVIVNVLLPRGCAEQPGCGKDLLELGPGDGKLQDSRLVTGRRRRRTRGWDREEGDGSNEGGGKEGGGSAKGKSASPFIPSRGTSSSLFLGKSMQGMKGVPFLQKGAAGS